MSQLLHVVGWRLNGSTEAERAGQAATVVAAVAALPGQVPGLLSVEVGRNAVDAPDALDVGAVMVFASRAALDAYQGHPAHLALKALVAPLRSGRAQFDLERSAPAVIAASLEARQ